MAQKDGLRSGGPIDEESLHHGSHKHGVLLPQRGNLMVFQVLVCLLQPVFPVSCANTISFPPGFHECLNPLQRELCW